MNVSDKAIAKIKTKTSSLCRGLDLSSNSTSKFNSQGFSKVLNPINNTKISKKMSGTLVS